MSNIFGLQEELAELTRHVDELEAKAQRHANQDAQKMNMLGRMVLRFAPDIAENRRQIAEVRKSVQRMAQELEQAQEAKRREIAIRGRASREAATANAGRALATSVLGRNADIAASGQQLFLAFQ